jgi:hypothetical protein
MAKAQTWPGATAGNLLSSSRPAPQSFLSSWQTELASLGSGTDKPSENKIGLDATSAAEDALQTATQANPSARAATTLNLPATPPSASDLALQWKLASGQGSASATRTISPPPPGPVRQIQAARQQTVAVPQTATDVETNNPVSAKPDSPAARPASTVKRDRHTASAQVQAADQTSTLNASLALSAPIPAAVAPAATAQLSQPDARAASPAFARQSHSFESAPSAGRPAVLAPDPAELVPAALVPAEKSVQSLSPSAPSVPDAGPSWTPSPAQDRAAPPKRENAQAQQALELLPASQTNDTGMVPSFTDQANRSADADLLPVSSAQPVPPGTLQLASPGSSRNTIGDFAVNTPAPAAQAVPAVQSTAQQSAGSPVPAVASPSSSRNAIGDFAVNTPAPAAQAVPAAQSTAQQSAGSPVPAVASPSSSRKAIGDFAVNTPAPAAQAVPAAQSTVQQSAGSPVSMAVPSSRTPVQADQTQRAFGQRSSAGNSPIKDPLGDPLGDVNPPPQANQAGARPPASAAAGSDLRTAQIPAAPYAAPGRQAPNELPSAGLPPHGTTSTLNRISAPVRANDTTAQQTPLSRPEFSASNPAPLPSIAPPSASIPDQITEPIAMPIALPVASQIQSPAQPEGQTAKQRTAPVLSVAGNQGVATGKTAVASTQAAPPGPENSSTIPTSASSEPVASRNAQAQEASHTVGHGLQALQPQAASPAGDATLLMRDPATQNVALKGTGSTAESGSAPLAAHETFAAIDTGASSDTSSWTHIGAHRAEAGIQDPALGWIGVRADGSAGQVHATLTPESADAAQALGGHLAGLNAYLADTYTPVQSIHIGLPEGREAASSSSQDQGQGMGQNSGQSMNPNANQGDSSESPQNRQPAMSALLATDRPQTQVSTGSFSQPPGTTEYSGSHISVIA